jgi:N utilization substance protein A
MSAGIADAIRGLVHEKGISEELVLKTIEEFLLAAYKRKFGMAENAVVKFSDDGSDVFLYAQKEIVEEVMDPVTEIALSEALELNDECEVGDELLIEIDPKEFDRVAIQSAKQKAKQTLREIQKDTLYSEFHEKVGEMVIGYYQRERNGNIFVDLGKVEGLMPKRYQSPREIYRPNDRIKALIYEVNKSPSGLQVILSRTHTDFVKRIFELEVPEVYDRTVEIHKIVREPGYRTKLAVYSHRDDVDPVGACVGMKGVRIQAVVRELEGEKIDILKFETNAQEFIKNALSPAEVDNVYILDEGKRQALAVVKENQLSLAIGKQGLNVRLANRLVDWNIDVKTEEQFGEMDIAMEAKRAVSQLFSEVEEEEIVEIGELPDMPPRIIDVLADAGVTMIEDLIAMDEDKLATINGLNDNDLEIIKSIIAESVDIVEEEPLVDEEEEYEFEEEEETYECPECGGDITIDMTSCPNCGVGLSFEVEDEDEEAEGDEESAEIAADAEASDDEGQSEE